MLAGGKREREGRERGKSIHPSSHAQGLLNGISYPGWWRMKEKKRKGGKLPFNLFPSNISGASEWQGTLSCDSVLLRAHLFHSCMRVFRWHVNPKH
jgi:hypothetical protein